MHLRKSHWLDSYNEIKTKPYLKKNKNFNVFTLDFIINFTHNNFKPLKLVILQFLDKIYLDKREKKKS